MCNRILRWILVIFLVLSESVNANPIIIRSGIVKSEGQQQDVQVQDVSHNKGIANFEGDEGFNTDNGSKLVSSAAAGRYGENRGTVKDHLDENNFDQGAFHQDGGGDISDLEKKVAHKKGHHSSGFHNSYHKDEQGSNSSYFDDGGDEGDQYIYKTHKGAYGDTGHNAHKGANVDSVRYTNEGMDQGQYNNMNRYNKDLGNQRNYNRNQYYDDKEVANMRNAADGYTGGNRYQEEEYSKRPYFNQIPYQNRYYNRPTYPKKHITIYEDPRYERGSHSRYRQYGDDYVDLEVRPLNDRERYDRRADRFYDYYY